VPRAVIDRPKEGFPVPIDGWIKGEFGRSVERELLGGQSWIGATFDRSAVAGVLAQRADSSQAAQRVWMLYVLEKWAQRWL
jgi:asparagine synthase (glutamine-hydrolysing)